MCQGHLRSLVSFLLVDFCRVEYDRNVRGVRLSSIRPSSRPKTNVTTRPQDANTNYHSKHGRNARTYPSRLATQRPLKSIAMLLLSALLSRALCFPGSFGFCCVSWKTWKTIWTEHTIGVADDCLIRKNPHWTWLRDVAETGCRLAAW